MTRSTSFLVRLWAEPRQVPGASAPVRGFLRNLQTGEEHYVADPAAVSEFLSRSVNVGEAQEERSDWSEAG